MNTMLLFLALLVLLIACYAEDVCQHWSLDMTPSGTVDSSSVLTGALTHYAQRCLADGSCTLLNLTAH